MKYQKITFLLAGKNWEVQLRVCEKCNPEAAPDLAYDA
jgi:hypothetical protein